jgi:hypothetical protein
MSRVLKVGSLTGASGSPGGGGMTLAAWRGQATEQTATTTSAENVVYLMLMSSAIRYPRCDTPC